MVKHLGASTDLPGGDRLLDLVGLDSLDDTVLFDTIDLTEEDEHLALEGSLVAEICSGVSDGGEDVVEFVGHTADLKT